MNVQSGEVGPGTATFIFMLDPHRSPRRGRAGRMIAPPSLDAGLLIGRDHKFITLEGFPSQDGVEVQNPAGLDGKRWVAGENPAAVLPRANGILMQPAPHGVSQHAPPSRFGGPAGQFRQSPARKGTPCVAGSSQARALTCTTSSGGKNPGTPRAGAFFQTRQAFLKEALAP